MDNKTLKTAPVSTDENGSNFFIDVTYRNLPNHSYSAITHHHQSIELIFCISGIIKVSTPTSDIFLTANDFVFINSNVAHSIKSHSPHNEHYRIKFNPSVIEYKVCQPVPYSSYFFFSLPDVLFYNDFEDREYLYGLCRRCYECFINTSFSKKLMLQAAILELVSYIFEKNLIDIQDLKFNNKDSIFLETVKYINKNFASVTLEKAAKNASMSYSYFSRFFKKEFNTTFSKYLTNIRIQKSMEFLSNSSMNISSIALHCGFSNLSHYTKCFKEETGITPNKYRTIMQNK